MTIHRRFVDIAEGQMHLRIAGPAPNWSMHRPVALFHGSPGSARSFDRLIRDLAESRAVIDISRRFGGDLAVLYHTGTGNPECRQYYESLLEILA